MLAFGLAVGVDEESCVGTDLPVPLRLGEQAAAVYASHEVVLLIFKRHFQLLHVELGAQFVFAVIQSFQNGYVDYGGKLSHKHRVHATHVDRKQNNLLQVVGDVLEGRLH